MPIETANARTRKIENLKSALMRPPPTRRVSIQVTRNPKAIGVISDVLVIAKACGGAHGDCLVPERTSPQNSKRAIAARPGRAVIWRAAVRWVPAILHPLGGVPRSVVQSEGVRPERTDRRGPAAFARPALCALSMSGPDVFAPPVWSRRPSSRGIFPFRLGGQPIGLSSHLCQPRGELFGVIPADVCHRAIRPPPTLIRRTELATARGDASVPFGECHVAAAYGEVLANANVVNRLLARL